MGETCAVCKKGQGPEKCEVCGFSDNGFINRQFPIPEDTKNWIETVVKPYRAQWEKAEAAKKQEADRLAQLEAVKKKEAEAAKSNASSFGDLYAGWEALTNGLFADKQPTGNCPACSGTGKIRIKKNSIFGEIIDAKECPECNGTGNIKAASGTFFTDPRDGRVYKTVKIGAQIWMAENLAFAQKGGGCGYYENNQAYGKKYGLLYNWETAMKASPAGWHLPSKEEWQALVDLAGSEEIAGRKLKAKSGWKSGYDNKDCNGTDEYGFAALPGGCGARFADEGSNGFWWSSFSKSKNGAYRISMLYNYDGTSWNESHKDTFFSVRCIKD